VNDQLEVQLTSLRAAGEQMLQATLRIGDSVAAMRAVFGELTALGYEALPGATTDHITIQPQIEHSLDSLQHLKNQLVQTVSAVEGAMVAHFPPLGALLNPSPLTLALRRGRTVPDVVVLTPTFDPNRYVSSANRALYQQWAQNRDALTGQQAQLQILTATRADLTADLRALRNRTEDRQTPEIAHMQAQIQRIDADIAHAHADIERLQGQNEMLTTRLERVAPGTGANLGEIRALETGESADALKQYTEGCVNYVVRRIHIPAVLAHDAHLWNEIAAQNPQYGITQGQTPLPGAVLVMEREHSYADDLYGHVMVVERLDGAEVWVTDNLHAEPIKLSDVTTETSGANISYLYLPWHTTG